MHCGGILLQEARGGTCPGPHSSWLGSARSFLLRLNRPEQLPQLLLPIVDAAWKEHEVLVGVACVPTSRYTMWAAGIVWSWVSPSCAEPVLRSPQLAQDGTTRLAE